jgi:cytochrome b
MNAKTPPTDIFRRQRLGRRRRLAQAGAGLAAILGDLPLESLAAAVARPPVEVPMSVFIGLWFLLGLLTGAGVGGVTVTVWRFVKRRQGRRQERSKQPVSALSFYAMVFWSALIATGMDVTFKLLAAHRVMFAETLTYPRALVDWQFLPGLNLLQTFLVMGVASLIALLMVRRLARRTDITGQVSAWAFSAATGVLISIFVTMVSGIFFPALDFWRVPGALVLNFADDKRLVNLADLIGYVALGLALIAVVFGWRHHRKTRRNGSGLPYDRGLRR